MFKRGKKGGSVLYAFYVLIISVGAGGGRRSVYKIPYYYLISILVGVSMEVISHVPRSSPRTPPKVGSGSQRQSKPGETLRSDDQAGGFVIVLIGVVIR